MTEPGASGASPPRTIFGVGDLVKNTYRIEEILGRGGTSEVYRATSEVSGSRVAVKVLRSELSDNQAFVNLMSREEAIRRVRHDAVLPYFHADRTEDGRVFLVMDYVEGPGLDQKMREGGMSADDLLIVARRVAEGLQAAHAQNVVHRDLSPDNIILRGGDPADAVIIDFGIAKDTNPGAQTVVGNDFAGKYAYAAPEQLSGGTERRSDVYALGAVLLAVYRGGSPSDGLTPMEIVRKKNEPLDTDGVPDPLRTLIDRMTEPDPEKRLQTAGEVLREIRSAGEDAPPRSGDETVITPARSSPREASSRAAVPRRGRGAIAVLVAVLALAGSLGATWWWGLVGSRYPTADPYTLVVERPEGEAPRATGHVPTEDVQAALAERMADAGGTAELTVARGDIADGWGDGVLGLVDELSGLDEWQLSATNNDVEITGSTDDAAQRDRLALALTQTARPAGLESDVAIELRETILAPSELRPILEKHADCGELELLDPPAVGYPRGAEIAVGGQVAETGTEIALAESISSVAGQRPVRLETRVLNPTLCMIDAVLPAASPGGFEVSFLEGQSGERRPEGEFVVGDNPVIEVTIPADVTEGYLNVIVLDVSGNVYHLLPNTYLEDNSIAGLRDGRSGPVTVRLSHPMAEAEAAAGGMLAFTVDDTALGESQVIVLLSEEPILDGQRPTTESAASLADALRNLEHPVETLDRWTITTSES